jgi:diguanylate cyclase (GGDEF)-like protein
VRVLPDPARTVTFDQAVAAPEKFAAPRGAHATLGMDKEAVWLRIRLQVAEGGDGAWVLDFEYPLLRDLDVYVLIPPQPVQHAVMGNNHPFSSRPFQGRTYAMPLSLPTGPAEVLVRVNTVGGRILPVSLSRPADFHRRALGEHMLQGALGFLGLVLLLYSVAQWLSLRDNLYAKYALLVACSTLFSVHFFGMGEMYLWTDHDWLQHHMAGMTSMMAAAATALFVEEALGRDLRTWMRQALRLIAVVQTLATLAYGADLIDIQAVAIFMSTIGLAPALLGLPGAIARARRGDSVGLWFMIAWAGYFIASAILVGVVRGRIDANFWTLHSFQFGATLDMLIFMRIAVLRSASRHRDAQRAISEHERLRALAHSDPLTGLMNRRGLDDALEGALARIEPGRLLALYALDLDGFKPVNDQYGHDVGDLLLRVIAQRLTGCVRAGDTVARVGGDEFVVIAEGLPDEERARELGDKILATFQSPFALDKDTSSLVGTTIGFAIAPHDARNALGLLKAADAAMYAGKQQGKNRIVRALTLVAPA